MCIVKGSSGTLWLKWKEEHLLFVLKETCHHMHRKKKEEAILLLFMNKDLEFACFRGKVKSIISTKRCQPRSYFISDITSALLHINSYRFLKILKKFIVALVKTVCFGIAVQISIAPQTLHIKANFVVVIFTAKWLRIGSTGPVPALA